MDPRLIQDARDAMELSTRRLRMTIPSVLGTGESFALRLAVIGPDGLPDAGFDRTIAFAPSDAVEGLPASVRLDPKGDGTLMVEGLTARQPGGLWIAALPEGAPDEARSNPAWVFDDPPYRIFWGDLHVHTV